MKFPSIQKQKHPQIWLLLKNSNISKISVRVKTSIDARTLKVLISHLSTRIYLI